MLSTAALIVLASAGQIQYRACQTSGSYRAQAYAAPAYRAYAAPTYQAYAYQAPTYYQNYVEKTLFVPVQSYDQEVYASIVGDRLRQKAKAEALAASDLNLADQVGKLTAAVDRLQTVVGGPVGPVGPSPPTDPTDPANPPPPTNPDAAAALGILKTNCAKCHSGEKPKGEFAMFGADGAPIALDPGAKLLIDQAIYSQEMPPDKPLPDADYMAVRAWIGQDRAKIGEAIKAGRSRPVVSQD